MIYTGMIFQYDNTQERGLVMLSDGETKEFHLRDWIDTINTPAIGQKISYEQNASGAKIRVATQEDEQRVLSAKDDQIAEDEMSDVDEYIAYFTSLGYKLVKDLVQNEIRTVSLRMYTASDYGEALIKQNETSTIVTQSLNGKTVLNKEYTN